MASLAAFLKFLPDLPPWVGRAGLILIGLMCLLQAKFDWAWSDDLNSPQAEVFEAIFGRKVQRFFTALVGVGFIAASFWYPFSQ